jgi:hypothetical protein
LYSLEFLYCRTYKLLPDSRGLRFVDTPVIQVILSKDNHKSNPIFAIVDSGAEHCLFSFSIGTFLGIDVFAGEEIRLGSLGAVEPMKAYLHNVEMEVLTYEEEDGVPWRFSTRVAFSTSNIPRNILGREGFFKHAHVGFVEMEQKIYLSPYH